MTSVLLQVLRERTANAHQRLETELDLLAPPISRRRIHVFLERLHGFHRAWSPKGETDPAVMRLRDDLLALGGVAAEIDALPTCSAARGLTATPDAALGAHYVVEGSALGGIVIGRALAAEGWAPLSYFDAEGRRAAGDWRGFQTRLADVPAERHDAVAEGAHAAFAVMSDWLAPAKAAR